VGGGGGGEVVEVSNVDGADLGNRGLIIEIVLEHTV